MTHPGALLSAYLDGELTSAEREFVTAHIPDCVPCQSELADLHHARAALRALPMLEVPPGVLDDGEMAEIVPLAAATVAAFIGVATFVTPEPTVPITFNEVSIEHNIRSQLEPPLIPGGIVPAVTIPIGGAE